MGRRCRRGFAWAVAAAAAVGAAYGEDGSLVLGTALLLVLAGAAVGAAIATDSDRGTSTALGLPDALLGVAALAVVAAVWAPVTELADPDWVPVTLSALAVCCSLRCCSCRCPGASLRPASSCSPRWLPASPLPRRSRSPSPGRLSWLGDAWDEDSSSSARDVVGAAVVNWPGHVSTPLLLLSVAVALAGGRTRCAVAAYGGCTRRTGARSRGADGAGFVRPAVLGGAVDRRRSCAAAAGRRTGARARVIMQSGVRLGGSRVRRRRAGPGRCLVVRRGRDDVGRCCRWPPPCSRCRDTWSWQGRAGDARRGGGSDRFRDWLGAAADR